MHGCESWTIRKAEHERIDAFDLWCWRRVLRVPWTARRSNQSILKDISPEYSLEGLMLKLNLQYFGHLMGRTDSVEKTLMLGRIEGRRKRGWERMRWLDGISWTWVWASSGSWWWTGKPGMLQSMVLKRVRHDWETELNWPYKHLYDIMVKGLRSYDVTEGVERKIMQGKKTSYSAHNSILAKGATERIKERPSVQRDRWLLKHERKETLKKRAGLLATNE